MNERPDILSRRNVVIAGAVALGAVGAIAARPTGANKLLKEALGEAPSTVAAKAKRPPPPLGAMSSWSDAVGSSFYIRTPSGSILTRLTAVSAFPENGPRPAELARQEAFLVMFDTGRAAAPPGEGIYTVTHRKLGEMQIFLSACLRTATGMTAVFN